jgi:hypothetical protein
MKYLSKNKIFAITFFSFLFLMTTNIALAGSAHLTWNANSENDLAGYTIYYDTTSHAGGTCPTDYAYSQNVGNVTSYWFDNLTPGQNYYFQLTAKDTSNNESDCSTSPGEVSKLINYRSDFNNDHEVDLSDYSIFRQNYALTNVGNIADMDRSNEVDLADYSIFRGEYGYSF